MNEVKTYQQVNREDDTLSFGISKMQDIYEKHGGVPDEPHRHNYYTVVIAEKARGKHYIDFNEYTLADSQIFFIAPGQVHQIFEEEASTGFAIVFSSQFLVENNIPIWFIEDLNLFHDFGESPPLELNESELKKILAYASDIYGLHHSELMFKTEAIGSLLKLILIQCNNVCSLSKPVELQSIDNRSSVLSQFKALINEHYKEWHSIKEYASELHISPDYLNRIVKSQTGKTAKEHIQSRITVAAKRLLYFTDLSNKEIGYELGFSEQANFSAFFKNCVGISPSQFKTAS
jgi:AraC-like DNA-binding protein